MKPLIELLLSVEPRLHISGLDVDIEDKLREVSNRLGFTSDIATGMILLCAYGRHPLVDTAFDCMKDIINAD